MTQTRRPVRRWQVLAVVAALLLGGGVVAWWETGATHTVRGASAVGVDFGGLDRAAAAQRLASATQRVDTTPITLRTTLGTTKFTPAELGLSFDIAGTVDRAVQRRSPVRDLVGLLRPHRVDAASTIDRAAFDPAIARAATTLTAAARDGSVVYRDGQPVPVTPRAGDRIDPAKAADAVRAAWPNSTDITVPTEQVAPTVTEAVVSAVARGAAAGAVASDLVLRRSTPGTPSETVGRLPGADIGRFLSFQPDGKGQLVPRIDRKVARDVLGRQLDSAAAKPVDASFSLASGAPTIQPSTPGREIEWDPTIDVVSRAVTETDVQKRTVDARFRIIEPKVTTRRAQDLGVREVVSEFTTGGFSAASGENIRQVAQEVNGALVLPGETFSLNGYTGPRGTAQGYVESGIILNGRPDKAVGGGISQFATTLYNGAYFAGLADEGHTEHSYYISRYPEAREATVYEGAIDLQFRNDTPYGIVIESSAGSSSVTVRMWSTKNRTVESLTGSRSLPTAPSTLRLPKGPHCVASQGQPGFTTSNTRVITDDRTGAVSRTTRTVKYDPVPEVICQ